VTPLISLSRALSDVHLLGAAFESPSFWTWKTLAKVIDGEPLREQREMELFRECTGRAQLPTAPVRRVATLVGRRGGKDRFMSGVAVWRAALCADWRKYLSAGEQAVVLLLGADRKQAAILRRYCEGLLNAPLLAQEVTRRTDDIIEFRNGASLEIATNDVRLVRGRSAIAVLGSECAHWRTDEYAASSDEEVVNAAEPSMAMCPDGGMLLLASSVYRKKGYMYRKFKQLHGNEESEDICWFAPSATMNPKLPTRFVEKALAEDSAKAGAEYLNQWREDLTDFIPVDVVEGCTDFNVYERPPRRDVNYCAYCDKAGGTGSDSFTIAFAHREYDENVTVRLDLLRERKPRFAPAAVIRECAELMRQYGIGMVQGDGFAGGFHADEWQRNGITFTPCEKTTSENYLHTLPMLLNGRVRLLDNPTLRTQLIGLERHVQPGGRETVTHAHVASAHDDLAAAACGAIVAAGDQFAYIMDMDRWI
jgi:hypothetical protein